MITSSAAHHSFVFDADGKLWASGFNGRGQLGLGDVDMRALGAVEVPWEGYGVVQGALGYNHSLLLDRAGVLWAAGSFLPNIQAFIFVQVPNLPPIRFVACGHDHSVAVDREGRPWAFSSSRLAAQGGLVARRMLQRSPTGPQLK